MEAKVRFADLFAGIGGLRLGFEQAFLDAGIQTDCVMTSEIKPYALETLRFNFPAHNFVGDITKVQDFELPEFDFLLAGFPCQPFSAGGKRLGFVDTRGTLFFHIEEILRQKQPFGFILENVEGLVKHDLENKGDKIGRTLKIILHILRKKLGYKVFWKVMDAYDFGLPQSRKRVFIIGTKTKSVALDGFEKHHAVLKNILEKGKDTLDSAFVNNLLSHYKLEELFGKAIKDKRGGANNIHSWDIEIKGKVSKEQRQLLNNLFKERRRKKWAVEIGIDWMDGMPLTLRQIQTFFDHPDLQVMLDDLVDKEYLRFEHPKKLVKESTELGIKRYRVYDESKPKGYNIVTGKLSFEINKILDPEDIAPTIVATDVSRIAVPDGKGLRRLTIREGLRLFGFPEWYELPVKKSEAFDLLGNTVAVPVVNAIAQRIAKVYLTSNVSPVYSS